MIIEKNPNILGTIILSIFLLPFLIYILIKLLIHGDTEIKEIN